MVDAIRVGTQGFALLVAQDGRLIAHGNPDEKPRVAAGENLREHQLVAMTEPRRTTTQPIAYSAETDTQSDGDLSLEYPAADGRTLVGVAAPVAALGWTVIVEQPTSEAFALAAPARAPDHYYTGTSRNGHAWLLLGAVLHSTHLHAYQRYPIYR